jgi:GINS complex subunit 4
MDVNRVKYLLRSYLRTRLQKIEDFAMNTIVSKQVFNRLSKSEQEYVAEYVNIIDKHMKDSVLDDMPDGYKSLVQQVEEGDDYSTESFDMSTCFQFFLFLFLFQSVYKSMRN